jgi:hypothetical protein
MKSAYYVNIVIIILLIITSFCCLFCDDIKENLKVKEEVKEEAKEEAEDEKENFLDWSMYNPPISNGFMPSYRTRNMTRYSNRSQAFYNQGWYPNMVMPPQVIGCGGRRQPCLGGTQEAIQVINNPIDISERNIAPVNVVALNPDQVGVIQQVGVLYKIFGSLNEIFPLYGIKRYRNSDTWDYFTKVGREGNFVQVPVLTRRINNNELQTNDQVRIEGNSAKFRVTMYDKDFPTYNPYFK